MRKSPHDADKHQTGNTRSRNRELPKPLPRRTFIALVDLDPRGDRAWIRRMIQGDRPGDYVLLRPTWTSCTAPFRNGRSGYFVATVTGIENGILVVDPIEAGLYDGYRLPDGWQLPADYKPLPLSDEPGKE